MRQCLKLSRHYNIIISAGSRGPFQGTPLTGPSHLALFGIPGYTRHKQRFSNEPQFSGLGGQNEGVRSFALACFARSVFDKIKRSFANMNELASSLERQDRSRFAFLSSRLSSLIKPSVAVWAPIPLRLIVGYGFLEHGYAKLTRGPEVFAAILHAMGVPAPHFMAWLTILTELIGGLAVLLGAFVPLVSLPMAAVLVVAMLSVHLPYGFSSIKLMAVTPAGAQFGPVGYECNLLYLACLAALVMGGSGPLAIDGLLRKWRKNEHS